MSTNKTFHDRVIDAIMQGNLEEFKKLRLGKNEINMRLQQFTHIKPQPKYNKNATYQCPQGPTPLMLAVLCEQDEIVQYILENKEPDLGVYAGTSNAFHLSITTIDHKCFDLLLQTKYYQQNINAAIQSENTNPRTPNGRALTALHSAVSQRNYYAVYRMLSPFPPIKYFLPPEEGDDQIDNSTYQTNIDVIAPTSGSTPLRIAAYMHDDKMVALILRLRPYAYTYLPLESPDNAKDDEHTAIGQAYKNETDLKSKGQTNTEVYKQVKNILSMIRGDEDSPITSLFKQLNEEFHFEDDQRNEDTDDDDNDEDVNVEEEENDGFIQNVQERLENAKQLSLEEMEIELKQLISDIHRKLHNSDDLQFPEEIECQICDIKVSPTEFTKNHQHYN